MKWLGHKQKEDKKTVVSSIIIMAKVDWIPERLEEFKPSDKRKAAYCVDEMGGWFILIKMLFL